MQMWLWEAYEDCRKQSGSGRDPVRSASISPRAARAWRQPMKPMTFRISTTMTGPRPPFAAVVDQLYQQYARLRGNIIGHTLRAPMGTTGRQMSLALTRVRERWELKKKKRLI